MLTKGRQNWLESHNLCFARKTYCMANIKISLNSLCRPINLNSLSPQLVKQDAHFWSWWSWLWGKGLPTSWSVVTMLLAVGLENILWTSIVLMFKGYFPYSILIQYPILALKKTMISCSSATMLSPDSYWLACRSQLLREGAISFVNSTHSPNNC